MATAVAWAGEGVRIADVAAELRELRAADGGATHSTLTSVMNLVIWAPSADAAREVEEVVDGLTDHHPSRAVLVVPGEGPDRIDARVEVQSHADRPGGRALRVEQIVLTLRGAVVAHAGSAVIPLLRPELPTFLWWPAAPDASSPTFEGLAQASDRLITETGRELGGRTALARLATTSRLVRAPVTDLAWAVLTPWRQIIAMSLRGEPLLALRVGGAAATIATPSDEPPLEALLLAGWLADVLGDHLDVRFVGGAGDEDILGIELSAGRECVMELAREQGPATVTMRTAIGGPRRLPLPSPDRTELLAGELELRRRDRSLERALVRASALG